MEETLNGVHVMDTLQKYKNSWRREITWIPRRSIITERSWDANPRTRSTKCDKVTRNPTWIFYKIANGKEELRSYSWGKALLRRPIQGCTTLPRRRQQHRKDRRTPWIQTHFTVEGKIWPDTPENPMLNSGHPGLRGHGHLHKVFMKGSFVITNMATITITYLIWCPCRRPVHNKENKLRTKKIVHVVSFFYHLFFCWIWHLLSNDTILYGVQTDTVPVSPC